MLINNDSKIIKNISGVSKEEIDLIKAFLQGAVYCWAKNRKDEVFALRLLVGGKNTIWTNTPLQVLYKKHIDAGKDSESANEVAGQDAGKILKAVLQNDVRKFEVSDAGLTNGYRWVQ